MEKGGIRGYSFEGFTLDLRRGCLLRGNEEMSLRNKCFELLKVLVESQGRLVGKEELVQAVWPHTFVGDDSLAQCLMEVRRALGDDSQHYIKTVPRRGYLFNVEVKEQRPATEKDGGEKASQAGSAMPGAIQAQIESVRVVIGEGSAIGTNNSAAQAADSVGAGERRLSQRNFLTARAKLAGILLAVLAGAAVVYGLLLRNSPTLVFPEIRSLAVLPLENLSGDPAQDYFADAMTDALITNLAKIEALQVVSRQSVMKYKQTLSSDIARELKVDALVGGTVLRSGGRIRITAQLIHVATDRYLWAESYERDLRDVVALQGEVARAIAGEVRVKLTPQDRARLAKASAVNPEAFDYYLRGAALSVGGTDDESPAAIEMLEQAVVIDPSFAVAHAALAWACVNRLSYLAPEEQRELQTKAKTAVERAFALDPDLPEAYIARGYLLRSPSYGFDDEQAIQDYRRALALNPNLDQAHGQLGQAFLHIGLLDEGLLQVRKAAAVNPGHSWLFVIGQALFYQGNYEQALAVTLNAPPDAPVASQIAWALFQLGRKEEAWTKTREFIRDHPEDDSGWMAATEALFFAAAGESREAEDRIKVAAKTKNFVYFHHIAYFIACAYAQMGKPERAIRWLQQTVDTGFSCYPFFNRDSSLDPLRKDPRFAAFMEQQRKQWEHCKATLGKG
jgi:TolB-like protein/DNA-binding winged helix-turn-helix (wHTH) protein/tetratricopeptide (TPR) repeat protein